MTDDSAKQIPCGCARTSRSFGSVVDLTSLVGAAVDETHAGIGSERQSCMGMGYETYGRAEECLVIPRRLSADCREQLHWPKYA